MVLINLVHWSFVKTTGNFGIGEDQINANLLSVVSHAMRYNKKMKNVGLAVFAFSLLATGFWLGRSTAPQTRILELRAATQMQLVQNQAQPRQQAPNDPRELIPLNPNQGQGRQPGQGQQPQPGQAPEDCPVMIYQDGQLFTFPRPGQQPGQGQGNQPGQPGGAQELFPLNPNAPSAPSTPNVPSSPSIPIVPNSPSTPTPRS